MKKEADNRIEVKATVIEVLEIKTETISVGRHTWDAESEARWERREIRQEMMDHGCGRRSYWDGDDEFGGLCRGGCYEKSTARVRARYTVDGQVYEREVTLSDMDNKRLSGKKIYLTLDRAHPEEPLSASKDRSKGFGGLFWISTILAAILAISATILIALPWSQIL